MLSFRFLSRRPNTFTEARFHIWALLALFVIGGYTRIAGVLSMPLPLGDGGLFYQMGKALINHKFILPATVAYNGMTLPFAYPPLGIYAEAFVAKSLAISLLDVMRFLPIIVSTVTLFPVYGIAREMLGKTEALLAALFFTFYPPAFNWCIMGGGATRAWGYFWALTALYAYFRFHATERPRWLWLAGLFCGLTALSHPGAAFWLVLMLSAIVITETKTAVWTRVKHLVVLGAVALLVSALWLASVVARGETFALLNALHTGHGGWYKDALISFPWGMKIIISPWVDSWVGSLSLLGLWNTRYPARKWAAAWLVLSFLFAPRAATRWGAIWVALLAAIGANLVLQAVKGRIQRLTLGIVIGTYLALSALLAVLSLEGVSVTKQDLAGMIWASDHFSPGAEVLVIPVKQWWGNEFRGEWMPALTPLRSACLVQGSEWTGEFAQRAQAINSLWEAYHGGANGIVQWLEAAPCAPKFVWVPRARERSWLVASLKADARFRMLYADSHNAFFAIHQP